MSSTEARLSYARSRASNGALFGRDVDRRSTWARRQKDLLREHIQDLAGVENTSAAERSLLRRAATISVELELLEAKFVEANGARSEDLQLYMSAANTLNRLLQAVGLQRRSRDVTPPTLIDIANEINEAALRNAEASDVETDEGVAS